MNFVGGPVDGLQSPPPPPPHTHKKKKIDQAMSISSFQYENGCIQASNLYALKDVRKPLKCQPLFKITLEDGETQVLCLKGYGEIHPCTMLGVSELLDSIYFICKS